MQGRHDLADAEWAIISPLLPDKPRVDDRRAIGGIFHILRTGTPWRDLPERCGSHATVCNLGQARGVERLFEALASRSPGAALRIPSPVPPTQPRRTFLQQAQTLPRHRDPLSQARKKLARRNRLWIKINEYTT